MRFLLLAALLAPALVTGGTAPFAADVDLLAGEAEGWDVPLTATVTLPEGATAAVRAVLGVEYRSPEGWTDAWTEDLADATVEDAWTFDARVRARFGAGEYALVLRVAGEAEGESAPVLLALHAPGPATAEERVAFDPADDAPSSLALTSDSVNADGKLKSPGEDVVTRFVAEDADGLSDVLVRVARADGSLVAEDVVPAPPAETRATLEHRRAWSPLPVGEHRLTLVLGTASASRTFVVRDAKPALLAVDGPDRVRAGDDARFVFHVGDRNSLPGERGPAGLEARLFRATTAVAWSLRAAEAEGEGRVPVAAGRVDDVSGGHGRSLHAVRVETPPGASPGDYRLALYADGVRLGDANFALVAAPRIASLEARDARPGGVVLVTGRAEGLDAVTLRGPAGEVEVPVERGAFRAELPVPRGLRAGEPVRVQAFAGAGAAESDVVAPALNVPPDPRLDFAAHGADRPPRVLPGAALSVSLAHDDANGDEALLAARLLDGEGRVVALADGGTLVVPSAPAGMYVLEGEATDPHGAVGRTRASVFVGAWVEVVFPDGPLRARPDGAGLVASARVTNAGNVAVLEALVLAPALGEGSQPGLARLVLADGTTWEAPVEAGRARLLVDWPPGEATLEVRWTGLPEAATEADLALVVRGG